MGHLTFLKQEYRDLVDRLDRGAVSLPDPGTPAGREGLREILELLFTPEDATLAARLPVMPTRTAVLARRLGEPVEALRPRLEAMADKGLLLDLVSPKGRDTLWMLAPPVVGFFEFSMMRAKDHIPKKRMAEAMEAYVSGSDAFAREVFDTETVLGRTLVHEDTLDEDAPEVLDWERATSLLTEAKEHSVSLCMCRHKAEHLGEQCDYPVETCMSLDGGARWVLRHGFGRRIEKSEAFELLHRSREAGLVQLSDNVQQRPAWMCNCCGCCCEQLKAINQYDLRAVTPSRFVARTRDEACVGCGRCARACPIGAITMTPRRVAGQRKGALVATTDEERCIGCGVCVPACRKEAKHMAARPTPPRIPVNAVEYAVRRAIERGRLADLLFDEGAGRGQRFLNQAIRALGKLPPAQRIMANEQVRSRFVKQALAKVRIET